jgi:pimeloyl-ACP methyl ester carboxylesterase
VGSEHNSIDMPLHAVQYPSVWNGFVLVCLPGLGGNGAAFAPASFQSIVHCGTIVLFADYMSRVRSITDMATYIWEELEHVSGKIILLGYSMGGFVAQIMYSQLPSRVTGIVMLCTAAPTPKDMKLIIGSMANFMLKNERPTREEMYKTVFSHKTRNNFPPGFYDQMNIILDHGIVDSDTFHCEIAAITQYIFSGMAIEYAKAITCPTLILYGSDDRVIPVKLLRNLHTYIPSATVVVVPDVGHHMIYEQPIVFSNILADWMTRIGVTCSHSS